MKNNTNTDKKITISDAWRNAFLHILIDAYKNTHHSVKEDNQLVDSQPPKK